MTCGQAFGRGMLLPSHARKDFMSKPRRRRKIGSKKRRERRNRRKKK